MRTLYLHIGFHKTGSSSLQLALYNNRSNLLDVGWEFLSLDKLGNSSSFIKIKGSESMEYEVSSDFDGFLGKSTQDNVIVSGEHFSLLNNEEEISKLKETILCYFDKVVIIVYLRRQDKLALSFKQQAAKCSVPKLMLSSCLCGHSASALPELTDDLKKYLDFESKIKIWCNIFGKESVSLRLFEKNNLIDGDICSDFPRIINLPYSLESIRVNEGVSRLYSLCSHLLINLDYPSVIVDKVRSKINRDSCKVMPSKKEAQEFYSVFENKNHTLFDWFGLEQSFDGSFEDYPDESNYKFTEEEFNSILGIISTLSYKADYLTEKEIDIVRDSALLLEKVDLKKANSLMLIANRFRPHGGFIREKIEYYKSLLK